MERPLLGEILVLQPLSPGPQHKVTSAGGASTAPEQELLQEQDRLLLGGLGAGVGKGRTQQQLEITCLKLKGIYFTEL